MEWFSIRGKEWVSGAGIGQVSGDVGDGGQQRGLLARRCDVAHTLGQGSPARSSTSTLRGAY